MKPHVRHKIRAPRGATDILAGAAGVLDPSGDDDREAPRTGPDRIRYRAGPFGGEGADRERQPCPLRLEWVRPHLPAGEPRVGEATHAASSGHGPDWHDMALRIC